MKLLILLVCVLFCLHSVDVDACTTCTTNWGNASPQNCANFLIYLQCLESTGPACALTTPADLATAYTTITGAETCDLSDVCTCEFNLWSTGLTCGAEMALMQCLRGKTGSSCNSQATHTMLSSYSFINPCITSNTICDCEKTYVLADMTNKCAADKALVNCLRPVSGTSCTGLTKQAVAASAVFVTSCFTSSTTCTCEMNYVSTDLGSSTQCEADKTFISCLKGTTDVGCSGVATDTPWSIAASVDITTSCAGSAPAGTCQCEVVMARADRTSGAAACTADKTFISCLKGTTDVGCSGVATDTSWSIAASVDIATTCGSAPTDTCQCEVELARADRTTGAAACTAYKNMMACMVGATGLSCLGDKAADVVATEVRTTLTNMGSNCPIPSVSVCQCEVNYATSDRTTATDKCTADKALVDCLKGKTDPSCKGLTIYDVATSITFDTTCIAAQTVCNCEKNYVSQDLTGATAQCDADKALINCLHSATGTTCAGTAAHNAVPVIGFDPCVTSDAICNCEKNHVSTDMTASTAKCAADKILIDCFRTQTGTPCSGSALHILASSLTYDACIVGTDTTCKCEMTYVSTDLTNNKCTADRDLLTCLKTSTGDACSSGTKPALVDSITYDTCITGTICECEKNFLGTNANNCARDKSLIACLHTNSGTSCAGGTAYSVVTTPAMTFDPCIVNTDKCDCEKTYVSTNLATDKCAADKALVDCLRTTTGATCSGSDLQTLAGSLTYDTCITGTLCECEKTFIATNPTDQCAVDKALFYCLRTSTGASCAGGTANAVVTGGTFDTCTTLDACGCERTYVETDLTVDRCLADKTFVNCLKGTTGAACNGDMPWTVATSFTIEATCAAALTDTCQCEVTLAKAVRTAASTDACTAYKNMVSCMKSATGVSCVGGQTAVVVATNAQNQLGTAGVVGTCAVSDTCQCEIAYAIADRTTDANKCTANGNLVQCLRSETDSGCMTANTVASLAAMAEQEVPGCTLTDVCSCEIAYVKEVKTDPTTHCTHAKTLLSCLYTDTSGSLQCDGTGTKAALETFANNLISTSITGCQMEDTCACEQIAAAGACTDLKNGLSCLRTATSRGCDGVKLVQTVANETQIQINALTTCSVDAACTCEMNYVLADVTTDANRCTAARTAKTCLDAAKTTANGAALTLCDATTSIDIAIGNMTTVIASQTCGAMKNMCSVLALVLMAMMVGDIVRK